MIAAVVGIGVGLGLLALWGLLVPSSPNLASGLARWDRAREHHAASVLPEEQTQSLATRAGRAVVDILNRRGIDWLSLRQDLAIVGTRADEFFAQVLVSSLVGFIAPIGLAALTVVVGFSVPAEYVFIGAVLAAVVAGTVEWAKVHDEALTQRAAFRRSLSSFFDLVAMSMAAGRGHPEALPDAAHIGTGWVFDRLQDTIARARDAGITPWAALGQLGQEYGIHELEELGGALRLVGDDGAQIRESLTARATTLRDKRLNDATGKANQASQSLVMAQTAIGLIFFAYLMYPPIIKLFTG